jgi:hypothetical protein
VLVPMDGEVVNSTTTVNGSVNIIWDTLLFECKNAVDGEGCTN